MEINPQNKYHSRLSLALFVLLLQFYACNTGLSQNKNNDLPFQPVNHSFSNQTLLLPEGFEYEILFTEEKDSVVTIDGKNAPAKGMHDLCIYIPIDGSSAHGYLYINHETIWSLPGHQDGGGGTVFEVKKENGRWKTVGSFKEVDFTSVGGTLNNCGGTLTPYGTLLVAEEFYPQKNIHIYRKGHGFRDTTDFNGIKRYKNFGWMVEIDPYSGKALRKLYSMGRYVHEDAHCMIDGRTVYLTDDYNPAVFFKFIAKTPGDYSQGQLYAYRQSDDGSSGSWITLPMEMDSLVMIREIALRKGASMFIRHEWIEEYKGRLFITETGMDYFDWNKLISTGRKPARHLMLKQHQGNNQFNDPFGRILVFDPETDRMEVFLEGGVSEDGSLTFSNPDCITKVNLLNENFLVINEDILGTDHSRVNKLAQENKEFYNETYFLNLFTAAPALKDLNRFLVAPRGSEATGGCFTPDGKTYFLNIQHPDPRNPTPFNRSCTVAITGFDN